MAMTRYTNNKASLIILGVIATALPLKTTTAQEEVAPKVSDMRQLLAPFRTCLKVKDTTERARCYDQTLNSLEQRIEILETAERDRLAAQRSQALENFGKRTFETDTKEAPLPKAEVNDTKNRLHSQTEAAARIADDKKETQIKQELRVKEITSIVKEVRRNYRGEFRLILENGQIWAQSDSKRIKFPQESGFKVRIYDSDFGGLRVQVVGEKDFARVERLR